MVDRNSEFRKHFTWMYSILRNSYDVQQEEMFGGILRRYFNLSTTIETGDFPEFLAVFGSKFPEPDAYSRAVGEFVAKKRKEEAIIDSAPTPYITKQEQIEVNLQNDIITGLWPLFGTDEGKIMVARLYAYVCLKNNFTLPEFWKGYADRDPIQTKPFEKKELRAMGLIIEDKNRDKKGFQSKVGQRVGSIVSGYFVKGV